MFASDGLTMSRASIVTVTVVTVALTAGAVVAQQRADADQVRMRQRISMMEGVLERAVSNGADNLLRQVETVVPDSPRLTGAPEVRGFVLEGYGLFFDVEVPGLALPVTWPVFQYQVVQERRDLQAVTARLRVLMAADRVDPQMREELAQVMRQLERVETIPARVNRAVNASRQAPPLPATAASQVVDVVDDPQEGYTREVRAALIDAMLENSGHLDVGPGQFLTVAARDNMPANRLIPGDATDFSTLILRVRGSDLAAFRSGQLSLEEARKTVDVREY
jgi:hypothetical protein